MTMLTLELERGSDRALIPVRIHHTINNVLMIEFNGGKTLFAVVDDDGEPYTLYKDTDGLNIVAKLG